LYEQKYKTEVLKKKVCNCEQMIKQVASEMNKLKEENIALKQALHEQT